jgi:elongation of very long chain fatty acids protein 6
MIRGKLRGVGRHNSYSCMCMMTEMTMICCSYIFLGSAWGYLFLVWWLERYMRTRPPYSLRTLSTWWNAFLCIYSIIGALIVVPFLILNLLADGYMDTVCSEEWFKRPWVAIAIASFVWSKIFELFDTVLLRLKRKPVMLLHWYHHVTVLLYCWLGSWNNVGGTGLFFSGMNFFVHSIMYGYYWTLSAGRKCRIPAISITILQIVQMVIGIYVIVSSIPCSRSPINHWSALGMYFSYFLLFVAFFVERYMCKKASERPALDNLRVTPTVRQKDD